MLPKSRAVRPLQDRSVRGGGCRHASDRGLFRGGWRGGAGFSGRGRRRGAVARIEGRRQGNPLTWRATMLRIGLVVLTILPAATLAAQSGPSFGLSPQATYWRLDHGPLSGNTTRWGPTVGATFRPSRFGPLGMRVSGSYAPESD